MRQPLRAIVRWTALVLVVQTLGTWVSRQLAWPVTWPVSWAVYTLAGREASRQGRFRHAPLAGGAVAVVADIVSAVRIALKDIDPAPDSPIKVIVMTLAVGLWGASWGLFGGLIGRLHQRRALLAFLIGVGPVLLAVSQIRSVSPKAFTWFVLWPATLLGGLVRRHNVGTPTHPVYEGTPIDLLAVTLGVVLSIILYSAIAYALLAWIDRRRAHPGDLDRVGA